MFPLGQIHIFLNPLQPDKHTLQLYNDAGVRPRAILSVTYWYAVEEWNQKVFPTAEGATSKMRPVFLCLNFREAPPASSYPDSGPPQCSPPGLGGMQ